MKLEVAVIKGDGVGPEMMNQAIGVLQAVCKQFDHELCVYPVAACGETIESCDQPLPQESLKVCQSVPAVLFGNTGLEKYRDLPLEKRPEAALMGLRRGMKVTTNIRPVRYYPALSSFSPLKERILEKGLDFVFVRDIVGGILCSDKVCAQGTFGREAYEYEYYNERIIMDTARIAFELARSRNGRVANLDKSNVLESSRLWRQTVREVSGEYPEIALEHYFIDNAAMRIMESPHKFDVIVTSNVFGDIISDEGTQMTGTAYLYASAEINKNDSGIYTPNQLHHPDESVIGRQIVNPIGMIAATALMLRFTFHLEQEAEMIETAIAHTIQAGFATRDIWTEGKTLLSTSEMGERVAAEVMKS